MALSAVMSSCVTNTSSEPDERSRKPRFDTEKPSGSEIVELTKLPLVILTPVALVATRGPCTVTLLTELFADSAKTPTYCWFVLSVSAGAGRVTLRDAMLDPGPET